MTGTSRPGFWKKSGAGLQHAREHCDLYIATDDLTPAEILAQAVALREALVPWAVQALSCAQNLS